MLTRIGRMSKMSYLNIQNRSQCSFGCALEVHLTPKKLAKIGSVNHELILSTQLLRSPNVVLVLKYGESNTMESALNTWQMPQTAR